MKQGNCDPQFRFLLSADSTWPEIEGLREKWQHSISHVQEADDVPRVERTTHQNCYTFALGHDRWVGPGEMGELVRAMQPKAEALAASGDLVAYLRDNGAVAHAGLVQGELVRSKWSHGSVWDHGVFEVPIGYGTTVQYFAADEAKRARMDVAWTNRMDNRVDASGVTLEKPLKI